MSIKFYTLASQQIKRPLTKYNVISLDIPAIRINLNNKVRDYHVMFDDEKKLEVIKEYCKHEYLITSININDLTYYCSALSYDDKGILFVGNTYCKLDDLSTMIETKAFDFDEQRLGNYMLKLRRNKDGTRTLEVVK